MWGIYAGENAEYAMGGTTIELFCASYKATHPTRWIECGNINSYGYNVRWSDGTYTDSISGLALGEFNGIYANNVSNKALAMWLASPSAFSSSYLMDLYSNGYISHNGYQEKNSPGLRPIVCLKSDVQLQKQVDGSFIIL